MAVKTNDALAVASGQSSRTLLRVTILCFIAAAAIASRLFSVISEFYAHAWPESWNA